MKRLLCVAAAMAAAALCAGQAADNAVALKNEPHHHLLFENDYVRAWRFGIQGHDSTLLHNHDQPYFGVALGEADYVNAVVGKPETHAKLSNGQISYSKGGFAHSVRTETDTPFRNFTIELLKPQGTARNRCAKVLADAALDCPSGAAAAATPLTKATTLAFETDEVEARTGAVAAPLHIAGADAAQNHVLAVLENSEIKVQTPGHPAKELHAGDAMWLPTGKSFTLVRAGKRDSAPFFLLTIKDSGPH